MPRIINDEMIVVSNDLKKMIRNAGYAEVASLLNKTESYIRSMASKGKRKIRKSDEEKIMQRISAGEM
jgi:DNA-directed RNA polymerase specialized sigma24 family protein